MSLYRIARTAQRDLDTIWCYIGSFDVSAADRWLDTVQQRFQVLATQPHAGRRRYANRMRERAVATLSGEDEAELARVRRGWCLGSESFRERMLVLIEKGTATRSRRRHPDAAPRTHGEKRAEELIVQGLAFFGVNDVQRQLFLLNPGIYNCRRTERGGLGGTAKR